MNQPQPVTASFTPPPASVSLTFPPGTTDSSQTANICPNNDCTNPNSSSATLTISVINPAPEAFSLTVLATEFYGDGLCPYPVPNTQQQIENDLDCRFASFFNYGNTAQDGSGSTVVPLCYPYANGNCVHYQVYATGSIPGTEPDSSLYTGPVFWKIGFLNNNQVFSPPAGSYWAGAIPRLLDNPDDDEFTPAGVLPYGSNCNYAMQVGTPPAPYSPTIYCQFDADITTYYDPTPGLDPIGGKSPKLNDVVVAFLPTSPGYPVAEQQPLPQYVAPTITGTCVTGCGNSAGSNSITFSEGTAGMFTITSAGYPTPTLTCTQQPPNTQACVLPSGVTFSAATGLISGTPADGTAGTYSNIVITATNINPVTSVKSSASQPYSLTVSAAPLTISASSATMTYGGMVPTITASYSGFVNGDQPANLGPVTCTTTATSESPVGSYSSSCTATDSTYTIQYIQGTVTVTPAPLVITAGSGTMTYGGTVPTITPSYSGFVNGDTAASLTTQPTCSTTATNSTKVGSYPTNCAGAVDLNYSYQYVNGLMTVTPATPAITWATPMTITYGTALSATQLDATANVPGSFVYNPPAGTVLSPGSHALSVSFTPTDRTDYTSATATVTLTVSALEISPTSANFGTVYLGLVGVQFISLTNSGSSSITISNVQITAPGNALGDYGNITLCPPLITALPARLPAGKSCEIAVGIWATTKIFSPTASTATLTITDSAAGSPHSVPLTTQVINPQATLSSSSLTFQAQKVGTTSAAKSVTLTNTGNTPLTIGTVTISGNFSLAGTTCSNGGTVAAGANCVINVTFTPAAKGTRTGSVTITDNALISPQVISLAGVGN